MNIHKTSLIAIFVATAMLSSCAEAPSASESSSDTSISASVSETTNPLYVRITTAEARAIIESDEEVTILDVRTVEEYEAGHIPDAIRLEFSDFDEMAATVLPDKDAKILVYCRSGNRSKTASEMLLDMGYTDVSDFGGYKDW